MRENKYQVYDHKQKMMFDVTEISQLEHGRGFIRGERGDSGGKYFVTYGYLDKKIGLGPNGTAPIVYRFSLRQYTGLIDKNGAEIYEGDIVKGFNRISAFMRNEKVTFLNGCYMFGNWNAHEYFNRHQEIEVIGNIYENLALLKGELA